MINAFKNLSVKTKVFLYTRESSREQTGSDSQLTGIYASNMFRQLITSHNCDIEKVFDVGTAFGDDYHNRRIFSILKNKHCHIFGFDASRFSRNLGGAGEIIELIQRNNVTVYITCVSSPYIVTKDNNIKRFYEDMVAAREESVMRSNRARDFARVQAIKKAALPYNPPHSTPDLLKVICIAINGCENIQTLYDAVNAISPVVDDVSRLGVKYVVLDRERMEMKHLAPGDFKLKDLLRLFNSWGICEKGKKAWTEASLYELVRYHFKETCKVLFEKKEEIETDIKIEMDMDMDDKKEEVSPPTNNMKPHHFEVEGSIIFCRKCGLINTEIRQNGKVVSCI